MTRRRAQQLRLDQVQRAQRRRRRAVYAAVASVLALAVGVALVVRSEIAPRTPRLVPAGAVANIVGGISAADGMAIL